jgi:hypothetical protein
MAGVAHCPVARRRLAHVLRVIIASSARATSLTGHLDVTSAFFERGVRGPSLKRGAVMDGVRCVGGYRLRLVF